MRNVELVSERLGHLSYCARRYRHAVPRALVLEHARSPTLTDALEHVRPKPSTTTLGEPSFVFATISLEDVTSYALRVDHPERVF